MKEKSPVHIFDANIFLTGIDFNIIEGRVFERMGSNEKVSTWNYFFMEKK